MKRMIKSAIFITAIILLSACADKDNTPVPTPLAKYKPTVAFNSAVAERYPQLVQEVNRRDGEIVAYGVDMGKVHHGGMTIEEETDLVRSSVSSLRQASNQRVTGWWSPARSQSMNTLDLVAAEGIEYVCDWINDDLPTPESPITTSLMNIFLNSV